MATNASRRAVGVGQLRVDAHRGRLVLVADLGEGHAVEGQLRDHAHVGELARDEVEQRVVVERRAPSARPPPRGSAAATSATPASPTMRRTRARGPPGSSNRARSATRARSKRGRAQLVEVVVRRHEHDRLGAELLEALEQPRVRVREDDHPAAGRERLGVHGEGLLRVDAGLHVDAGNRSSTVPGGEWRLRGGFGLGALRAGYGPTRRSGGGPRPRQAAPGGR